jgi:ubiquinone/menaquinone biosynthesis C-methylase UbiE
VGATPEPTPPPALHRLLRRFFRLLYHELAWSYDLVAAVVSLGRWNEWVQSVMPFVEGPRVLELAYGTGRLQRALRGRQLAFVTGIDESRPMARLARRRLASRHRPACSLVQARAQSLPYCGQTFDTVVATFPTDFMIDLDTLHEIRRVLRASGRLVVVAAAWIVSRQLHDRAAAWLFRSTRQSPDMQPVAAAAQFMNPLETAGFKTSFQCVGVRGSTVLIVVASK